MALASSLQVVSLQAFGSSTASAGSGGGGSSSSSSSAQWPSAAAPFVDMDFISRAAGGSRRSQSQSGSELLDEAPLSLRARSFQDLFGSALPRTEASSAPPRTAAVAVPEVPSDEASDDDDDDGADGDAGDDDDVGEDDVDDEEEADPLGDLVSLSELRELIGQEPASSSSSRPPRAEAAGPTSAATSGHSREATEDDGFEGFDADDDLEGIGDFESLPPFLSNKSRQVDDGRLERFLLTAREVPNDLECSICYQPFQPAAVTLPCAGNGCRSFFHGNCILPWLMQNPSCPLCRCDIKDMPDALHGCATDVEGENAVEPISGSPLVEALSSLLEELEEESRPWLRTDVGPTGTNHAGAAAGGSQPSSSQTSAQQQLQQHQQPSRHMHPSQQHQQQQQQQPWESPLAVSSVPSSPHRRGGSGGAGGDGGGKEANRSFTESVLFQLSGAASSSTSDPLSRLERARAAREVRSDRLHFEQAGQATRAAEGWAVDVGGDGVPSMSRDDEYTTAALARRPDSLRETGATSPSQGAGSTCARSAPRRRQNVAARAFLGRGGD